MASTSVRPVDVKPAAGAKSQAGRVLVYCPVSGMRADIRGALAESRIVHECRSWDDVFDFSIRAEPVVAVLLKPSSQDLDELATYRQCYRATPIVVVTERDADIMRELAPLGVDEVVWRSEVRRALAGAVGRSSREACFSLIASRIEEAEHLASLLRTALMRAVLRPTPVTTCTALAALAERHVGTLARYWDAATAFDGTLRMEDFVGWMILMRAAQRRSREGAWDAAAAAVRVDRRRLHNSARRLAGMSLKEIDDLGFAGLGRSCEDDLRRRLLQPRGV